MKTGTLNRWIILLVTVGVVAAGCRTAYYSFWESLGKHKRDLLRQNVEAAREEQQEASDQFQSALARLQELYGFEGGELEEQYNRLQNDYDQAAAQAEDVRERIAQVEQVATDLFSEWEIEIEEIENRNLRNRSQETLRDTRKRYRDLHTTMEKAEERMEPVLQQLKDQVLFLKHNLNAQAIGELREIGGDIELEIAQLIAAMRDSIKEADAFIESIP